jgi:hypothetical protein
MGEQAMAKRQAIQAGEMVEHRGQTFRVVKAERSIAGQCLYLKRDGSKLVHIGYTDRRGRLSIPIAR